MGQLRAKSIWAVSVLAGLNLLWYVLLSIAGISSDSMIIWGLSDSRFELWQLLSYMMVHADFAHFISNTFVLILVGLMVCRYIGGGMTILVYLLSGITGGVAFMLSIRTESSALAGSSAAVLGLAGCLLAILFRLKRRHPVWYAELGVVIAVALISFCFNGFNAGGILAHSAGLTMGLTFGLLCRTIKHKRKTDEIIDRALQSGFCSLSDTEKEELAMRSINRIR